MQASSSHLRLYTVKHVWEADRTTLKKVNLSQPIAFAAAFTSLRGPGIVCLSPTGVLHVSQRWPPLWVGDAETALCLDLGCSFLLSDSVPSSAA